QAEDGIRDKLVTGVQTCALPIFLNHQKQNYNVILAVVKITKMVGSLLAENVTKNSPQICRLIQHQQQTFLPLPLTNHLKLVPIRSEERRVGKKCRDDDYKYHE